MRSDNRVVLPDIAAVRCYLRGLQSRLCNSFSTVDTGGSFQEDRWSRQEGGEGFSRVLSDGAVFERAGVNYSEVWGKELPPSATARRPELAGRNWLALGVSAVLHPRSPYVPTTHMNVRFLSTESPGEPPIWWFGGGFDLTPYYGFDDDCAHWHRAAREACAPFGADIYPRLKRRCDEYFFLRHRGEPRGIGGLFFDDWHKGGFDQSFAFARSVGDHFLPAYQPIVERRQNMSFGERERNWQLIRRGRYVEFNLLWDRGTLFGLQSGGRSESILTSMPPVVAWRYDHHPEPGTAEATLLDRYLVIRDWT